jgi:hypothetical protein
MRYILISILTKKKKIDMCVCVCVNTGHGEMKLLINNAHRWCACSLVCA